MCQFFLLSFAIYLHLKFINLLFGLVQAKKTEVKQSMAHFQKSNLSPSKHS